MWTAFSLSAIVALGTAIYAIAGYRAVERGASVISWIAGAPLVFVAFCTATAALWFTIAWIWRAQRPADARIGFGQGVRMFAQECIALGGSVVHMIFYRSLVRDPPPAPATLPIVLVHGVLCNAGVWSPLARFLRERGVGPVYSISYGPPLRSIEIFADQLAGKIADVRAATGADQVVLVTHSMGGLVSRAYLRRHGGDRVRKLITVGAPNHGSVHAYVYWFLLGLGLLWGFATGFLS